MDRETYSIVPAPCAKTKPPPSFISFCICPLPLKERDSMLLVSSLLACFVVGRASGQSIGQELGRIGEAFFAANPTLEASGLTTVPDSSHLVGVSDSGAIFFLGLGANAGKDCNVPLSIAANNFEGVAIDPNLWSTAAAGDKVAYAVHEGSSTEAPYLHKISYTYVPGAGAGVVTCTAEVIESINLYGALPCLPGGNGVESLAYKESSYGAEEGVGVFFVGLQDTGVVYEITSSGLANGPTCYDGGLGGVDGISGSFYEETTEILWSVYDNQDSFVAINTTKDCSLLAEGTLQTNEEGLAIDFATGNMYIASDEGNNNGPSFVSIHTWLSSTSSDCCGDGVCEGSEDCSSCPRDCPGKTSGNPQRRFCCAAGGGCVGAACSASSCTMEVPAPCTYTPCGGTPPPVTTTTVAPASCINEGKSPDGDKCSSNGDCCGNKCKGGKCR